MGCSRPSLSSEISSPQRCTRLLVSLLPSLVGPPLQPSRLYPSRASLRNQRVCWADKANHQRANSHPARVRDLIRPSPTQLVSNSHTNCDVALSGIDWNVAGAATHLFSSKWLFRA